MPPAVNSAAPFRAPAAPHVPRLSGGRSRVLQALVGRDVVSGFARVGVAICACVLSRVFWPDDSIPVYAGRLLDCFHCASADDASSSSRQPGNATAIPGVLKKRARVAELKRGTFMPVVRSTVGADQWPAAYPDARGVALQPGSQRRNTLRLHDWCHKQVLHVIRHLSSPPWSKKESIFTAGRKFY